MVIVIGLVMLVFVVGVDALPACGCALVVIELGGAALAGFIAEAPAAVIGESVEGGAESLEQSATSDTAIEMVAYAT